jgi:hypothetical protein
MRILTRHGGQCVPPGLQAHPRAPSKTLPRWLEGQTTMYNLTESDLSHHLPTGLQSLMTASQPVE